MRQEVYGTYRYCRECDYFTKHANTLCMHVALKHSKAPAAFCCDICPATFPTKIQLVHHSAKHTVGTYECVSPGCSQLFKNKTAQRTHFVRLHLLDKTLLYRKTAGGGNLRVCLSCGDLFTLNAVIYHVSGCSSLSPFKVVPEMVLNQQDEDILNNRGGGFGELEDIPEDIEAELNMLWG